MKPSRLKIAPKVPTKPPMTPARSKQALMTSRDRDPVQVYCRIRPLDVPNEESCVTVLSDTVVQVVPPETSQGYRSGTTKATQYTFTGVFDEKSTQKPIFHTVTLPLIEDLLHGKNSLLFAYGVTGSGKTHTMNGELQDGGIIPRCLDVIFNSIGHFQAKKYIFKPDRMNSFEIQSELDALAERQAEITNKFKTPARRGQENEGQRVTDATRISALDEDQAFAVFVTFVEVYNNTVFDLLDDTPIDPLRPGKIQSKILREDQHHNMYVHAVTEVEVKSADEAAEVLAKGQKRRRVAHTTLNAESSRSHSVFNIRVVQAPLDYQGATPEKVLTVGQLSLVDLAGSERNSRTKTTGERLREAGSINNTLMTLRSCMEILRENQLNGTNKMVPYRDSKITHLFKSYFDGEGKVRMIVCVNPRADDYDETLSVMRFAEMAQEVQIARAVQPNVRLEATPRATPAGREALLPGRRKANRVLTEAYRKLEQGGISNPQSEVPFDIDMVFSAARCSWPPLELQSASDDRLITALVEYLQVKIREQQNRREQQMKKCVEVRTLIREMEEELILKRQEVLSLNEQLKDERSRRQTFENRVLNAESANATLQRHVAEHQKYARLLEEELKEKDCLLNQGEIEILNVKAKEKTKRQLEREKLKKELDRYKQVESQLQRQTERFLVMRDLLDAGCSVKVPGSAGSSESDTRTPSLGAKHRVSDPKLVGTPSLRGPAVSTRKRRSRSVDPGKGWLDHRPENILDLDTVFQPQMNRAKSITKLVDSKTVTDAKISKYALTTQEQDSSGEIETKLYKGDVLTTVGGGAQVVLQDVEILRHSSPTAVKRHSDGRLKDVHSRVADIENRCGHAIEGHNRVKKHCP
ncbi:Kinesin-like protein [Daphnia magna]|uniref:Uncharacterized protein n=2 Tax=Daphnia magna TaxID=35525 RepID=A0ABR0AM87_9CRUS|nr:hypothetical protein OUZ56_015174 [Daphnia magna]KZS20441.1 Kinesin-like protein [Daphnia magna]